MKVWIYSDEIHQFHVAMLKPVLLILALLPLSRGLTLLWKMTEGSSQIMVGFFALSLLGAWLVVCFWSALQASILQLEHLNSEFELRVVQLYRLLPMLFLTAMLVYLLIQRLR